MGHLQKYAEERIGVVQTQAFLEGDVVQPTPRIPENDDQGRARRMLAVKQAKIKAQEERAKLMAEQDDLLKKYFNRFDYDNTGRVVGEDELCMLCTSLCVKLHLPFSPEQISGTVKTAVSESSPEWKYDAFASFFKAEFLPDQDGSESMSTSSKSSHAKKEAPPTGREEVSITIDAPGSDDEATGGSATKVACV